MSPVLSTDAVPVDHECEVCGHKYQVSARYARKVRSGEYNRRCRSCSNGSRRKTAVSPVVLTAERRFWIERFGLAGAIALSRAIWNAPPSRNEPVEALVASVVQDDF